MEKFCFMTTILSDDIMYQAILDRDVQFEGQFITAVKTTGIFCRPSCRARKPKRENVTFFKDAREALTYGYRPCKVCKPMQQLDQTPADIQGLLQEIEKAPDQKINDYQLRQRQLDPSRIRRWFKKHHGMTFQAYQRLYRINHAFQQLKKGEKVVDAAYEAGFESLSGFQDAFRKATAENPSKSSYKNSLTISRFTTPLGPMFAVASERGICLLEFTDRRMLETEFRDLKKHFKTNILPGAHPLLQQVQQEVLEYFTGQRMQFSVPLDCPGSAFQRAVWEELQRIPYAATRSYQVQAQHLDKPKAIRAVARANGANRIAIIVPCHRVLGADGQLTGYGGGLWRKRWLLDHEKANAPSAQ